MQNSRKGQKEEAHLIHRMARGDDQACSEMYDRFSGTLYSLAFHILNDTGDAESVVLEVFLSLGKDSRISPQDRGSLFSWLVHRTRVGSILRLRSRRGHRSSSEPVSEPAIEPIIKPATIELGFASALPPDELSTLELAYFGGFTVNEISRRLNHPPEEVTARLYRAIFKLRHAHRDHD